MRTKIDLGSLDAPRHTRLSRADILEGVRDHITYELRYSQTNILATMAGVRNIIDHYGVSIPSDDDAKRIIEDCRRRDLRTKTIIHRLHYLKLVAHVTGGIVTIRPPKRTKPENDFLTLSEGRMLIEATVNKRDRAIVLVGLVCGPRPCELVQIELEDVNFRESCIHIRDHGTGIKNFMERKAVMNDETVKALKSWIEVRPLVEDRAIFLNKYGRRMTTKRVCYTVKETAQRAGIGRRCYYYMLRHAAGTNIIDSGGSIMDAATQLGHKNLQTTMIYLHGNYDSLRHTIGRLKY